MNQIKNNIFALLVLLCFAVLFAQESKIVNGYRIVKGERPETDLSKIDKNTYEPGKISLKLSPEMENFIGDNLIIQSPKDGFVKTGVSSIDDLNIKFKAVMYKPLLYGLYDASPASQKHRDRHKAWGFHLWMEITIDQNSNVIQAVKEYMALPEIEFAEPVYKKQLNGRNDSKWTPDDTYFTAQWHYNNTGQQSGTADCDIDLPEAWDIEKGNPDVIVAVVDGGIQFNHPDIQANMWSGTGYNFVDGNSTITADDHGTHVAGTISAVSNNSTGVSGVAGGSGSGNGVRLMSCQVFTSTSSGGFDQAPIYAADNGAAISQNSWGYGSPGLYAQSALDAIDYFNTNGGGTVMNGGLTFFSAGNNNSDAMWYPGCYSGSFGVAATNNQDKKSYYSNYSAWVDVSAPGGETNVVGERGVASTISGDNYAYYEGTSMACPHVSGVAALIISHAPGFFNSQEVADIIKNTTDNIYTLNPTYTGKLGTGRINANNALLEVQDLMSGIYNPKSFSSSSAGTSQINLTWTKNDSLNNVMTVYSTDGVFGEPSGSYYDRQYINGGGIVLYRGSETSFNHTGLSSNTTYFYKAWSYTDENIYSSGICTQATTAVELPLHLPFTEYFNNSSFPNSWTQQNSSGVTNRWTVSSSNKAGGLAYEMKATFQNINPGTSRLVTPPLNTAGQPYLNLKFRHMLDDYAAGATLKIQSSTDGVNWTDEAWSLATASNSNVGPVLVNTTIVNNVGSITYVAFVFTGNLYNIDYWYVDNVEIKGQTFVPGVPINIITSISGNDLVVDWDATPDATNYDVYSSNEPYGTFVPEANVMTNKYTVPYTESKKFYYIIARNETKNK